jgi:glutathione S-transferase
MYKLYTRPGTGGFVVEAALQAAGAPFERTDVPKGVPHESAFLAVSPLGQVPAIVLPDGKSMTESAAICMLLAERYPEARLAPAAGSPERADFLRWMAFMSGLYLADLRYFYANRYTADPAGIEAVKEAALTEMDRDFAILDAALAGREGLAGARSIADVYLLMLAHWHPVADRPRDEWKNIVRLCEALKQEPALAELNERHRIW